MANGLGLEPRQSAVPETPAVARQAPARQEQTTQKTTGIPQFSDDPLAAIGVILSEVGAGIEGRPSPLAGMRRQIAAEDAAGIKRRKFQFDVLQEAVKNRSNPKVLKQLSELAGFDVTPLARTVKIPDVLANRPLTDDVKASLIEQIEALPDQDPDTINKFIEDNQERLLAVTDFENRPLITGKAKAAARLLAAEGVDISKVNMTLDEFEQINANAAQEVRLTPSEIGTLRNDEGLQRTIGITPESVLKKKAERPSLEDIANVEAAKAEGKSRDAKRKLGTPRTVETTENILLPNGGSIPKGTSITVRPVKGKSFSVTSVPGPDGMIEIEIPDAIIPGVRRERKSEVFTKSQRGKLVQRIAFLDDAVKNVDLLRDIAKESPTGAAGEVVGALQGTYDQFLSLVEILPGVRPFVDLVESGMESLRSERFEGDVQDSVSRLIDPNLPAIEIIQEAVAIALAASSFPSTQRVPVEAIKKARENIDITGLFGPGRATALVKLNAVRSRLTSNRESLSGVLGSAGEAEIETPKMRRSRLEKEFGLTPAGPK